MKTKEKATPKRYQDIKVDSKPGVNTGIKAFDKWISSDGGMSSALFFLSGTSGAGKSTFSKILQKLLSNTKSAMYQSEYPSSAFIKQTSNIKITHSNALIVDDAMTFVEFVKYAMDNKIMFLIIDSIQSTANEFDELGKDHAIMKVFDMLRKYQKATGGIVIIIGQSLKSGGFAGTNTLKHLVDVHIHMTYNPKNKLRWMTASKNRLGGSTSDDLYYRFVKDERVLEFYDEADKTLDEVIEHLENIEAIGNDKSKLFLKECSECIERIQSAETDKSISAKRIDATIADLSKVYGFKR